jgi:hypothetical protein
MPSVAGRTRNILALLGATCLSLVLSGCVMIKATSTSQSGSMGPVTLTVAGCVGGSPGCGARLPRSDADRLRNRRDDRAGARGQHGDGSIPGQALGPRGSGG